MKLINIIIRAVQTNRSNYYVLNVNIKKCTQARKYLNYEAPTLLPAGGRVGRVWTAESDRCLGFKSTGSILTSRTETSSLSRVVRDGGDPGTVPLSGLKKVQYGGVFENDTKTKKLKLN